MILNYNESKWTCWSLLGSQQSWLSFSRGIVVLSSQTHIINPLHAKQTLDHWFTVGTAVSAAWLQILHRTDVLQQGSLCRQQGLYQLSHHQSRRRSMACLSVCIGKDRQFWTFFYNTHLQLRDYPNLVMSPVVMGCLRMTHTETRVCVCVCHFTTSSAVTAAVAVSNIYRQLTDDCVVLELQSKPFYLLRRTLNFLLHAPCSAATHMYADRQTDRQCMTDTQSHAASAPYHQQTSTAHRTESDCTV